MSTLGANILTDESLGWAASLSAAFMWSFSVSAYKYWGSGKSATWLNLFKGLTALVFFFIAIAVARPQMEISYHVVTILAVSGLIGVFLGDSAFFLALSRIGGPLTSSIQCLSPSLTAILARIFLNEVLTLKQVSGLTTTSACLGLLLFFEMKRQPTVAYGVENNRKNLFLGVGFALIAAICQAIGAVIARPVLNGYSPFVSASLRLWAPVLMLFIWECRKAGSIFSTILSFYRSPDLVGLSLASFCGTFLGLTMMMYGMAHSPLGVSLALNSTYPIWIVLGERIFGKSSLNFRQFLLVIGSVAGIWMMV